MKTSFVILSLFICAVVAAPLVLGAEKTEEKRPTADEQTEAGFRLMKTELLGKLRFEMKASEVVKAYGKPTAKGKMENWEGVGLYVQPWYYPELGVELQMAAEKKDGVQTVYMIQATKRCRLSTTHGVRIGSTEKEVVEAYGKLRGDESEAGKTFVAGSTVGGVIFGFMEGKVVSIFIGAASE
ncbi:MAG: hypothetical protein ACYC67_14805 [Prosthecobacter sp.]